MGNEYRVSWRREGAKRVRKIYQTERNARELCSFMAGRGRHAYGGWRADGEEVGPEQTAVVEGPTLEVREVGEWSPTS